MACGSRTEATGALGSILEAPGSVRDPRRARGLGYARAQSSDSLPHRWYGGWWMGVMLSTLGRDQAMEKARVSRPKISSGFSALPSDPAVSAYQRPTQCPRNHLSSPHSLPSPPSPSTLLTPDPAIDLTGDSAASCDEKYPICPSASLPAASAPTGSTCPGRPL